MSHPTDNDPDPILASGQTLIAAKPADSWDSGAPAGTPAEASHSIFAEVFHSIRRWWKLAAPIGVLLAVAAAAVLFLTFEHRYRASCWFKINSQRDFLVFQTQDASERFVDTQIELVRSPLVLSPIVREPQIARHMAQLGVTDPLDWLSRNVRARLVGESEFLEISFESTSRQAAKDIVEAVADSYVLAYKQETDEHRQDVVKLLEEEKNRAAQQVDRRREDVRLQSELALGTNPFALKAGPTPEAARAARRTARIGSIEQSLMQMNFELGSARSAFSDFIDRYAQSAIGEISNESVDAAASKDPWLAKLDQRLTELRSKRESAEKSERTKLDRTIQSLEDELKSARARARENAAEDLKIAAWRASIESQSVELDQSLIDERLDLDAGVRSAEARVEALQDRIAEMDAMFKGKGSGENYRRLTAALADAQEEAAEVREGLASLMRREQSRSQRLLRNAVLERFDERVASLHRMRAFREQYYAALSELDTDLLDAENQRRMLTLDLEFAKRELEREEDVHQRIADRLLALRTEERAPSRVSRKTEEALIVNTMTRASLIRKTGMASAAAFLLPFGLALLWDMSHKRVGDHRHLRRSSQRYPLLGEISRLPATPSLFAPVSIKKQDRDHGFFQDSVLNLAAQIAANDDLAAAQVFTVTSAVGGEGKSTLSANLAKCLAMTHGERVLLIDGDLRAPSIAEMFEMSATPGLAEVLAEEFSMDKAIHRTADRHVFVLPAGETSGAPYTLIANGTMKRFVDGLRKHFRYIIIDTPPVLSAGETLAMTKMADATLYCAMRDVSNMDEINEALLRLESSGCKPAGVVLNGVPANRYRGSYGRQIPTPGSVREAAVAKA
ncbi:MAG: polysaccharide biosynthesis tyrosine autokinase [Planctomycetales bacterium]|nr:polysaccharide biosynthesis tyrosine autokinase [Planctomycetales bacterium]